MILVFGRSGQLGQALARAPQVVALDRGAGDLNDPAACVAAIHAHAPRAVINAAAFTAVDLAEAETAQAMRINSETPGAMAAACAVRGIPFVSVSTDYVFDGTGTAPWRPEDRPAPLNAYGRSKAAGEAAIAAAGGAWAVLRTAWVVSGQGGDFLSAMLRLGAGRDQIRVVADQIGGPTPATDLARACLTVAEGLRTEPDKGGLYHFAGAPEVSRADFARAILARAGIACVVQDIPSTAWPTPAARPLNARLDCGAIERHFGLARPDWRAALDGMIATCHSREAAQ